MPALRVFSLDYRPFGLSMARCAAVAIALALSAASGAAQSPDPQDGQSGGFDGLMETLGMKPKSVPMPDFVEKSRPADDKLHYIPVGTPHPVRSDKLMTPAEIAAATQQLDKARLDQQRRAGLKSLPVPLKTDKSASAKAIR